MRRTDSEGGLPILASWIHQTTKLWRITSLALIALCLVTASNAHSTRPYDRWMRRAPSASNATQQFDWYALKPADTIKWTPCDGQFKCARLKLPLDYLAPHDGRTTAIALRLLPAKDKANYRGTILINPGGPGGSGTMLAEQLGANISRIVGGSFDILGFDPRGVGASTPRADCFDNDIQRQQWAFSSDERLVNLTDGSLPIVLGRLNLTTLRCEGAIGGPDEIGRFMDTASVARDMLEITQKLGQEKVQYWGFSYGTVLGQYFAALFPDKVGRVVIDGVFDGYNYRAGLWNSNLVDTDKVLEAFFQFCFEGGPGKCAIYSPSPNEIKARFFAALAKLEQRPIPLVDAQGGPLLLTAVELRLLTFQALYTPITGFPVVALGVAAVEADDTTTLSAIASAIKGPLEDFCAPPPPWLTANEALLAISCGDAAPLTYSPADFAAFYGDLSAQSPFSASFWAHFHLQCTVWPIRPPGRFTGDLAAAHTSHPLLLISATFDTVCPLTDARKVVQRYGGAGLLIQNSYGHCSIAAPSLCTAKHVREYFVNGTLPAEGTVCEVDELPFVGRTAGAGGKVQVMSAEDGELLDAMKAIGEGLPMLGNFGRGF